MRFVVVLLSFLLSVSNEELANFTFLCADADCSKPISTLHAIKKYSRDHNMKKSFKEGDQMQAYGRSEEIKMFIVKESLGDTDKYVPQFFVREMRLLAKANVTVSRLLPVVFAKSGSKRPSKQIQKNISGKRLYNFGFNQNDSVSTSWSSHIRWKMVLSSILHENITNANKAVLPTQAVDNLLQDQPITELKRDINETIEEYNESDAEELYFSLEKSNNGGKKINLVTTTTQFKNYGHETNPSFLGLQEKSNQRQVPKTSNEGKGSPPYYQLKNVYNADKKLDQATTRREIDNNNAIDKPEIKSESYNTNSEEKEKFLLLENEVAKAPRSADKKLDQVTTKAEIKNNNATDEIAIYKEFSDTNLSHTNDFLSEINSKFLTEDNEKEMGNENATSEVTIEKDSFSIVLDNVNDSSSENHQSEFSNPQNKSAGEFDDILRNETNIDSTQQYQTVNVSSLEVDVNGTDNLNTTRTIPEIDVNSVTPTSSMLNRKMVPTGSLYSNFYQADTGPEIESKTYKSSLNSNASSEDLTKNFPPEIKNKIEVVKVLGVTHTASVNGLLESSENETEVYSKEIPTASTDTSLESTALANTSNARGLSTVINNSSLVALESSVKINSTFPSTYSEPEKLLGSRNHNKSSTEQSETLEISGADDVPPSQEYTPLGEHINYVTTKVTEPTLVQDEISKKSPEIESDKMAQTDEQQSRISYEFQDETIKRYETMKEEENNPYEIIFEYVPDISNVFYTLSNIREFFSSSFKEKEQNHVDSEPTFEQDCIVHPMENAEDFAVNIKVMNIPFMGKLTTSEREWIIGSCAVLLVSLCTAVLLYVFNYGQSKKRIRDLIGLVNRLESKLLVATKEILSLQDELEITKTKHPVVNTFSAEKKDAITEAFNQQLKQYQERNTKLEDKVTYLEKELESVSNYALEMHKLFENSLSTQSTSRAAIDEVEELRALADKQETKIDDLRREMDSILIENQMLKENNETSRAVLKKLENECNVHIKKNLELSEKQREMTLLLDREVDNCSSLESQYKSEIYEMRSMTENLLMNVKRNQIYIDILKQEIEEKAESVEISDNVQLKAQLFTLEAINNELTNQLKDEKGARRMVEEHMGDVIKELNNLKKSFEVSEKERNDAVTKVQILTDFFKSEITKLQKELQLKEELYSENENKDQLLSQKLASLKEEIKNQKMQIEALRKEIMDQESSYKMQLANAEQKTQQHWFEYRKCDRKYKECQQEAANLRNRIVILETTLNGGNQKLGDKNNEAVNGDLTIPPPSVIHPMMISYSDEFVPLPPPPILGNSVDYFEPPEPIFSTDERLPPLGSRRVPSPLPFDENDLTLPPPIPICADNRNRNEQIFSLYRRTQLTNNHRFKSRQQRNSADSHSSGLSLESLDKSGR